MDQVHLWDVERPLILVTDVVGHCVFWHSIFFSSAGIWYFAHFQEAIHTLWGSNFALKLGLSKEMLAHQGTSPSRKHTLPNLVMCTPLSSLMVPILSRRSNPSSCPSTIRASMCTGSAIQISSLILLYPQIFRVLPSTINTFASLCRQKWHSCLHTNVCEQPKSKPMHSYLSTDTLIAGSVASFICAGRRLVLTFAPLSCFPGTLRRYVQSYYTENTVFRSGTSMFS